MSSSESSHAPEPEREHVADTRDPAYAERLTQLQGVWWKRILPVQLPYQLHLRSLRLGRTLDVGCGIGRNLAHLPQGSLGVDHNPASVGLARAAGLQAFTPEELRSLPHARTHHFDSLLLAHILEHLSQEEADDLLREYVPRLRPGGRLVCITPQERGYTTDATHVRFVDDALAARHAQEHGFQVERQYSFPLPRGAGQYFPYNEFVLVARRLR